MVDRDSTQGIPVEEYTHQKYSARHYHLDIYITMRQLLDERPAMYTVMAAADADRLFITRYTTPCLSAFMNTRSYTVMLHKCTCFLRNTSEQPNPGYDKTSAK